jgi:hypothetical protein
MPQTQLSKPEIRKASSSSPENKKKGQALAEALSFLKDQWNWSGNDLWEVTHIPPNTINNWISNKLVPVETPYSNNVQVILHLLSIHKNLDSIFENPENQLLWLKTLHPDFHKAPIEQMKESLEGLIGVRQYLDYVRGRGA